MKNESTFRVTLHLSHPKISAEAIMDIFKLPTKFVQSVGEERKTKRGGHLGGIYPITNISFLLHEQPLSFADVCINEFMLAHIKNFDVDYLSNFVQSGGACNFLIGVFSNKNVMFEISCELIFHMASANISVKYDFYGEDDHQ